jgi:hypothetical protein
MRELSPFSQNLSMTRILCGSFEKLKKLLGDRRNGLKIAVLAILLLFKIDQTEPNSPA